MSLIGRNFITRIGDIADDLQLCAADLTPSSFPRGASDSHANHAVCLAGTGLTRTTNDDDAALRASESHCGSLRVSPCDRPAGSDKQMCRGDDFR